MSFKSRGNNSPIECKNAATTQPIPDEVLRGLSPEATERLRGFVQASENFRRRVYGDDPATSKR